MGIIKELIEKQREIPKENLEKRLDSIGKPWFAAYAKYAYLDESYTKWDIDGASGRISNFKGTIYMHEIWLKDIKNSNDDLIKEGKEIKLKDNAMGLTGKEYAQIVEEILTKTTRDERLSHYEKILERS